VDHELTCSAEGKVIAMSTMTDAAITESAAIELTDTTEVEVVEIEFDELGRFESLSMCCNVAF
jgi:hypothetical protein